MSTIDMVSLIRLCRHSREGGNLMGWEIPAFAGMTPSAGMTSKLNPFQQPAGAVAYLRICPNRGPLLGLGANGGNFATYWQSFPLEFSFLFTFCSLAIASLTH